MKLPSVLNPTPWSWSLVRFCSTALGSYVKDSLTVLALLAVCALTDWRLAIVAFLVIPAMAWPVSRFARALKRSASQTQGSLAALTTLTAEHLTSGTPWFVITTGVWERTSKDVRDQLEIVDRVRGFAYAGGRVVEVMVVRPNGGRAQPPSSASTPHFHTAGN